MNPLQPSPEAGENLLVTTPNVSAKGIGIKGKEKSLRALRLFAVYSVLAALLYFALRNVPFKEIWNTLAQLHFSQVAILFVINALVILFITARWWVIVRGENSAVPFLAFVRYRLAVFGLSYFTPGPPSRREG